MVTLARNTLINMHFPVQYVHLTMKIVNFDKIQGFV